MKTFIIKILSIYLYIGAFFSSLMLFSWSWSLIATIFTEFNTYTSAEGFITLLVSILMNIIISPLIRVFTWLPSMLTLLSPDVHIGFVQWAFPGFFEHLISAKESTV